MIVQRSFLLIMITIYSASASAGLCESILFGLSRFWLGSKPAPAVIVVQKPALKRWVSEDGQTYQIFLEKKPYHAYFDVRARVTDHGILHFYIITRNPGGSHTAAFTGVEAFQELMDYFGDRVRAVAAQWFWGTNLEKVNELTRDPNISLEAAVRQAWSAKQAIKFGFSKSEVVSFAGEPGQYKGIGVLFSRPESPVVWSDVPEDERSVDYFFGDSD